MGGVGLSGKEVWGTSRPVAGEGDLDGPPPCRQAQERAGDHKGPPSLPSSTLAPTDHPTHFLRLMPIGCPCGQ